MLYLLHGPDEYAAQGFIRELVARTALPRVDFSADNPPENIDVVLGQDLFAKGQVIVFVGADQDFLTENNIPLLAASTNHIVCVLPNLDKRTTFAKNILADKRLTIVECALPNLHDLPDWLVSEAKARGGELAKQDAIELLSRLGLQEQDYPAAGGATPSRARLMQELDKLLTYSNGGKVTREAIENLVPLEQVTLGLAIVDSITQKNRQQLYSTLAEYYNQPDGGDETTRTLQLIGLLTDQFRSQLLLLDALQNRLSDADIITMTAWKPGRVFVLKKAIHRAKPEILKDILTKLEALDIELKTSNIPPRVVLELVLAQVCS